MVVRPGGRGLIPDTTPTERVAGGRIRVDQVVSPSYTRADRFTKRRLNQERHIPVYWTVDGDERLVEVWTPEAEFPVVEQGHQRSAGRALTLELAKLFRPI